MNTAVEINMDIEGDGNGDYYKNMNSNNNNNNNANNSKTTNNNAGDGDDGDDDDDDDPMNVPEVPAVQPVLSSKGSLLKPIPEMTIMERFAAFVAFCAIATSFVAIIIEGTFIVITAGVLSSCVGQYAYWQQTQLTNIKALKETQKTLHQQVNIYKKENERLSCNINDLEETILEIEDIEIALDIIGDVQGNSIKEFEKQALQYKQIFKKQQQNVAACIIQNLMTILIRSDTDANKIFNQEEVQDMINRLNQIDGILTINEDRFRNIVVGQSVDSLLKVVNNLVSSDNIPTHERIFELK